jgi:tol-pal system protein YbgF
MNRFLAALALVALAATGCATRGSVRQAQEDLAAARADVTDLRLTQELSTRELARTVGELRALDARIAEAQAALRETGAELSRLRARVDTVELELREAKAQVASAPPLTPPTPPPGVAVTAAPTPTMPTPGDRPPRPEALQPDGPEQAYNAAMATFRAREHGQAVLDLLDFIAKYPKHPLAANAQYWIGEAYYVQRDFRQALLEFQRVVDAAPTSAKAADALLKVGLCHTNLREAPRAHAAWQRVIHDYPSSEAAVKARGLLRAHASRRP